MESTSGADGTNSSSTALRLATALVVLAALAAAVRFLPVQSYLRELLAWIQQIGLWGMVTFVVLYIAATLAFLPGSILTLGAGYAFGVLWGTILVSIGSTVGAALSFLVGRFLARDWVREKIANRPRFRALDNALQKESFKVVFLLRLVPLIPFNALNYGFGVSKVSFRRYFFASWVGMLPATVMYVYFGSLAEKITRLAAGTPEDRVPVWAIRETLRRALSGEFGAGVAQNLSYWLGFVAVVSVTWVVTRKARSELERLQQQSAARDESAVEAAVDAARSAHGSPPDLEPDDAHNRRLRERVHPPSWTNPTPDDTYNLVAVGGGTAGLVGAAGAAGLGARSALVERAWLGGDCLVTGCVPSKALLRSARAAAEVRRAGEFGVEIEGEVRVDFPAVMQRMRSIRAEIGAEDSAERFSDLGVDVHLGHASFVDGRTLEIDGRQIEFEKALIATGASPLVPPIDGLEEAGYLTSESIFSLTERPDRLAVVGGGPIGCELAQAFARFGADVTLVEMADQVLPNDDPDAAALVADALRRDGVDIRLGARVAGAGRTADAKRVELEGDGASPEEVVADEILVAAGRKPNVEGLALERANVDYDRRSGVLVDDHLRTTNSRIFAAGDVASTLQFTHLADAQARLVLRNALFFGRARSSDLVVPRVTYTDPELAHVGLSPGQARERGHEVETIHQDLADVHRAVVDGAAEGFVRVHLEAGSDTILGATVVAEGAGELVGELTLAMREELGLATLSDTIHPYPTTSAAFRRAADIYNRGRLKPWMKSLLETWFRWRR